MLAFEHTLASSAHLIQQVRSSFFPSLSHTFELSYGRLSSDMERASMAYLPDCQATRSINGRSCLPGSEEETGKLERPERDRTAMISPFF